MLHETIRRLMLRELRAVTREVDAYPSDELLWRMVAGIPNPGGTLALHIAGNLQHYVGAVLGGSGYVRDREAEFATRDLTRAEVRAQVEAAAAAVNFTLASLAREQAEAEYPERVSGRTVSTADFLMHLAVHLGYHLGQLDYHRRVLDANADGMGAISLAELPEFNRGDG